ncbi:tetratricopeptide repeat protein [Streptomyces venezuelae]|uniref:Tetratricopeptide repeat protein n=1 Tax=Streptomyces venezuelae TaxID=54571 RepID=A0A5P2DB11_STRVZ|nr:caspase family protein [Streptomyces venezuelae]QES50461.1 tetratricopeptide repeat protein [Streptomyces venezuelae]
MSEQVMPSVPAAAGGQEPGAGTENTVRGTALGIVVENYADPRAFPALTGAVEQMHGLCTLLEGYGYTPTVLADPGRDALKAQVRDWRTHWAAEGGNGPAVVLWSGHGVLAADAELRLIVADTQDPEDEEETYAARLLTAAALAGRADQVLLLIDTCYAGAGVVESLSKALGSLSARSLPPDRAAWLGVIASCRPRERAEGRGVLLDTVARVLREGPRSAEYRHQWSRRNAQVSGAAVIQAARAQWPGETGQRPVIATLGEERAMFANPRWQGARAGREPELVEHLVRAARGADRVDEGWFFSGRRRVLGEIVGWLRAGEPGLFLVTGGAGCGKSAVLGRISTLSSPSHRADIRAHDALGPEDPDPGEGSVDVSLHLRGSTVQQLAEALAEALRLPAPATPAALIAEVEQEWPEPAGRRPVLVLDGLDEAAPDQAGRIVEQLLAPLSRLTCVLLGSRDRPFTPRSAPGEPLDRAVSRLLDTRARVASLDEERDTAADIEEYGRRRLTRSGGLPAEGAAKAARLIAGRAAVGHGGFLFARMATDSVIRRFRADRPGDAGATDWEQFLPASISAAFTEDLAEGPQRYRDGELLPGATGDLLSALAWSAGSGMPASGVWEAAASALAPEGTEYTAADVDWLLNTYGRYVVEDDDGTQAVYRLYHREFAEHLLAGAPPEAAYRVARAMVGLLGPVAEAGADLAEPEETAALALTNAYVPRSLSYHAVVAGAEGIALIRELAGRRPGLFLPYLALALDELAYSRSQRGHRAEAVPLALEAAAIHRSLAEADPVGRTPLLAASLNDLAAFQSAIGDRPNAVTTSAEAARIYRELAEADPAAYLPRLAGSLNNLGTFRNENGDRHGALVTLSEATRIDRSLAEINPAAYLRSLAGSLHNLATAQRDNGDREGCLATAIEATDLYRTLAETDPAAHLPSFARALNALATSQVENGDRGRALATGIEATRIHQALAQVNPSLYLPEYAMALSNLATIQGDNGDRQGALATITEATRIYRTLTGDDPAVHIPSFAASLNNLATIQGDNGDWQGALVTITEATRIHRSLAEINPAAYLRSLAGSLHNLATAQHENGDQEGGLATAIEVTGLYRTLAEADPAAHLPDLARALNNLSSHVPSIGDTEIDLAAIREAVAIRRTLALANPAAHNPDLAASLINLAIRQGESEDWPGSLVTSTEATDIYRALVRANPAAHTAQLAHSLGTLTCAQLETGDGSGALATGTEAVALYRALAEDNPAAHLPNLAALLNNFAAVLRKTGDRPGALAVITEATGLYRTLAKDNPASRLPDLALTLDNLAATRHENGDGPEACAAATESVALYRALAQADPVAYTPGLCTALGTLALLAPAEQALAAFEEAERALAAHPEAARELAVGRAAHQLTLPDAGPGVHTLIELATSAPAGTAVQARIRLRAYSQSDGTRTERVATMWREQAGSEPPAWLAVPDAVIRLTLDWARCPSWAASRAFWEEHREELGSADAMTALEEFALTDSRGRQLLAIARAASTDGPEAAFRPYITADLLHAWLATPDWEESRRHLAEHAENLLSDLALRLLASGSRTPVRAVHSALLTLARADGIPAAYAYIGDHAALHDRLRELLAQIQPPSAVIAAGATLELLVHKEQFAARVHSALASALNSDDPATEDWPPATPAERDRALAEIAGLIGLHPQHAAALSALMQRILATEVL